MTTGPHDQMPATARRGHLRASQEDREQVIEALKTAFAQGRLTRHELDRRVGIALVSRICGDLAAVTADIPAGTAAAEPPHTIARAQARKPAGKKVRAAGWAAALVSLLAVLIAVAAVRAGNAALFVVSLFTVIGSAAVAWGAMVEARAPRRSRGQLPRRSAPAAGGQEFRGTAAAARAEAPRRAVTPRAGQPEWAAGCIWRACPSGDRPGTVTVARRRPAVLPTWADARGLTTDQS